MYIKKLFLTYISGAKSFWEEASRRTFGANIGHFNIKIIRHLRINCLEKLSDVELSHVGHLKFTSHARREEDFSLTLLYIAIHPTSYECRMEGIAPNYDETLLKSFIIAHGTFCHETFNMLATYTQSINTLLEYLLERGPWPEKYIFFLETTIILQNWY